MQIEIFMLLKATNIKNTTTNTKKQQKKNKC